MVVCAWTSFTLNIKYQSGVIKLSLQIQGEGRTAVQGQTVKYRGVFGTIVTIVRTEGPRSLYNGLVAGLQRQMTFASVRIGLYDSMKQLYAGGSESTYPHVLSLKIISIDLNNAVNNNIFIFSKATDEIWRLMNTFLISHTPFNFDHLDFLD